MIEYVRVAAFDQIPCGKGRPMFVAGRTIALFNVDGEIYALDDSCPHAGSSLGMGKLEGAIVQCRAHGLRFDVRTGCMHGAGGLRASTYPVRIAGNEVAIAVKCPAVKPDAATPKQQRPDSGEVQHQPRARSAAPT